MIGVLILFSLFHVCFAAVEAISVYTSEILAYDFATIEPGSLITGYEPPMFTGYFRAPETGLYTFTLESSGASISIGFNYECCSEYYSPTEANLLTENGQSADIFFLAAFYYPVWAITESNGQYVSLSYKINGGIATPINNIYYPVVGTPAASAYNVNTISSSYLMLTRLGSISTTVTGLWETTFFDGALETFDAIIEYYPPSAVTTFVTGSAITYTTETVIDDVTTTVIVDEVPISTLTTYVTDSATTYLTDSVINDVTTTLIVQEVPISTFTTYVTDSATTYLTDSAIDGVTTTVVFDAVPFETEEVYEVSGYTTLVTDTYGGRTTTFVLAVEPFQTITSDGPSATTYYSLVMYDEYTSIVYYAIHPYSTSSITTGTTSLTSTTVVDNGESSSTEVIVYVPTITPSSSPISSVIPSPSSLNVESSLPLSTVSLTTSGSSSITSTISSIIGTQTYIWTGSYTSTIALTYDNDDILVPSGGLFKRDAYETAILIPTPTSINWNDANIFTSVVEYLELYNNGQISSIDVTYTRSKESKTIITTVTSGTATENVTYTTPITLTEASGMVLTVEEIVIVVPESEFIETTITTTATMTGSLTSTYTTVVTTTNSFGETILYTEVVVVCPETLATKSIVGSISSTYSEIVTTIDNVGETIIYTDIVVVCPESTRTTMGSISSTSTGVAVTTNSAGATITYTEIVIYCPESALTSTTTNNNESVVTQGTANANNTLDSTLKTSKNPEEMPTNTVPTQSSTSAASSNNIIETYAGTASSLKTFSFGIFVTYLGFLFV